MTGTFNVAVARACGLAWLLSSSMIKDILCLLFHVACGVATAPAAPVTTQPTVVPEPATYALLGLGLTAIYIARKRN